MLHKKHAEQSIHQLHRDAELLELVGEQVKAPDLQKGRPKRLISSLEILIQNLM